MHPRLRSSFVSLLIVAILVTACGGEVTPTAAAPVASGSEPAAPANGPAATDEAPADNGDVAATAAVSATSVYLPATLVATDGEAPATGHPRLWLTPDLVTTLRAQATAANPLWVDGLLPLAERARSDMDSGLIIAEDCGQRAYSGYPVEMYAEFFAFLSLVHPNSAERSDYATRARTLLMHGLNLAALGPSDDESHRCAGDPDSPAFLPYRGPAFYTEDSDRPRWHGEGWALAIDWIYATLTAEDKATIATVFTRWGEEIIERAYHHPEPVGVINDPALLADRTQVRWAGNNYFTAHMRNLGLLALALDPADGGDALEGYLENAIGAWLYLFDELTYTDAQGGLLPEGFEYSPQTASYAMQFLLALKTASRADTGRYGQKVIASANPFWNDFVTGYLHSLSPQTENDPDFGQIYLPAWYGDAQHYWLTDFIDVFGSMGIYAALTGDQAQLNTLRWLELNTPAGGSADLAGRVRGVDNLRGAILYFILFPPDAPAPTDPRPALATGYAAPGMRRLFSRTSWGEEAAWLTYALSWNEIDHQMADGNHFEFYRNGEWLTKARTGYANIAEGIASSEFRNTMALQNVRPADLGDDDFRVDLWRRGSQYNLVASGDPGPLLHSFGDGYTFAGGDATNLYNSEREMSTAVEHASRALLWIQPDLILVYDRGDSPADLFKRVWFQLPQVATVSGQRGVMTSAGGQQLAIDTLLPAGATMQMADPAQENIR
jgi:hypothetical protein